MRTLVITCALAAIALMVSGCPSWQPDPTPSNGTAYLSGGNRIIVYMPTTELAIRLASGDVWVTFDTTTTGQKAITSQVPIPLAGGSWQLDLDDTDYFETLLPAGIYSGGYNANVYIHDGVNKLVKTLPVTLNLDLNPVDPLDPPNPPW
jgi:hypothetical protein